MVNLSPVAITPLLVPLSLLGWAAWSGASGLRTFLYLSDFICAMMLFGRPDNFYWAVLITPILFVGLLFAPVALPHLMTSAARPPNPGFSYKKLPASVPAPLLDILLSTRHTHSSPRCLRPYSPL